MATNGNEESSGGKLTRARSARNCRILLLFYRRVETMRVLTVGRVWLEEAREFIRRNNRVLLLYDFIYKGVYNTYI